MVTRLLQLLREHSGEGYKGKPRQLREITELVARGHLHPSEYFHYGLSREGVSLQDAASYMSNRFHWQGHLGKLNDPRWFALMDNKWLFHLHFQRTVRLPRFLGIYHAVQGVTWDGRSLCSATDLADLLARENLTRFVIKPVGGSQGLGVHVVDGVEKGRAGLELHFRDGTVKPLEEYLKPLQERSGSRATGVLLEECLIQHEVMARIAPYTVNTVRVVTLAGEESVIVSVVVARFGSTGSMVDNFSGGGYCVAVDSETGVLGSGRRRTTPGAARETHHGDSGVQFEGQAIPFWPEVRQLCIGAARLTPGLRSIGWDVVITPSGPVLIEGNRDWGLLMCQAVVGGYLQPAVVAGLKKLGVDVATERLPPLNLRRGLSSLLGSWR